MDCYLRRKQTHLSWLKRAMVVNWMMEIVSESLGCRETFANAVCLLDRYLAVGPVLTKENFQCVGGACILIASKLEDNTLSIYNIEDAADGFYSIEQI